jgi:hypothetical protein
VPFSECAENIVARPSERGPESVPAGIPQGSGTGNAVGQDSSGDTLIKAERALCV